MAKPVGVAKATKNNDNKHPRQREEWMEGKKIGRKKQVWVGFEHDPKGNAHWEKIQ